MGISNRRRVIFLFPPSREQTNNWQNIHFVKYLLWELRRLPAIIRSLSAWSPFQPDPCPFLSGDLSKACNDEGRMLDGKPWSMKSRVCAIKPLLHHLLHIFPSCNLNSLQCFSFWTSLKFWRPKRPRHQLNDAPLTNSCYTSFHLFFLPFFLSPSSLNEWQFLSSLCETELFF